MHQLCVFVSTLSDLAIRKQTRSGTNVLKQTGQAAISITHAGVYAGTHNFSGAAKSQ